MNGQALRARAEAAGLCVDWVDAAGRPRTVEPQVLRAVLDALGGAGPDPPGGRDRLRPARPLRVVDAQETIAIGGMAGSAYRLEHESGETEQGRLDAQGQVPAVRRWGYYALSYRDASGAGREARLAVAPPRCYGMADACAEAFPRRWGIAAQVYSVRGAWDAGIGDAGGMAAWADRIAAAGGDALGLSPLHASQAHGKQFSPYSPGDRRFLDPVYAAPVEVLGEDFALAALDDAGLRRAFLELGQAPLVDWPDGARAKWAWLGALHERFEAAPEHLRRDCARFIAEAGKALERHAGHAADAARDVALAEERAADGRASAALQCFAQWLVARSWSSLQAQCRAAGMAVGLVADLAVGFDPRGSEAAAWPGATLRGLALGAPPDAFNADGQVWGVGGWSPAGLHQTGYAPFIELLRATMRGRGGVRIDHILGLLRLWVVPEGGRPGDGVYLRYPFDDLLRLLALESWRQRAVVIGEDLGVVPEGFRDALARRGVLGLDVLLFTRDGDGAFLAPERWRTEAVATTTTHDLPTLAGWRAGRDLQWRARLRGEDFASIAPGEAGRAAEVSRLRARVAASVGSGVDAADWLRFVSRSPSSLALLPLEDALGLEEQPNLPGTVEGHPNWRRRLPDPLPEQTLATRLQAFAQDRGPRAPGPPA